MKRKLWLLVSEDKYELPLCVAETARELGEMIGVNELRIINTVAQYKRRGKTFCRYVKLEFDDDKEDY